MWNFLCKAPREFLRAQFWQHFLQEGYFYYY